MFEWVDVWSAALVWAPTCRVDPVACVWCLVFSLAVEDLPGRSSFLGASLAHTCRVDLDALCLAPSFFLACGRSTG